MTTDTAMLPPVGFTGAAADPGGDIYNRLLKERIVILGSEVNDEVANRICAQLLFLEGEDAERDIYLYINSPGVRSPRSRHLRHDAVRET